MDTLAQLLTEAANGRFPPPDGTVQVTGPPDGPAQAVVAFTAHSVVATSIDPDDLVSFDHPRVRRAIRYRTGVRVYADVERRAVLVPGRGLAAGFRPVGAECLFL